MPAKLLLSCLDFEKETRLHRTADLLAKYPDELGLHLDFMDGHFVPKNQNSIDADFANSIESTVGQSTLIDYHFMVNKQFNVSNFRFNSKL